MKHIPSYLKDFYKTHFRAGHFIFILLMMGTLIYVNYHDGIDKYWIGQYGRSYKAMLGYWVLYFSVFTAAYLIYSIFFDDYSYWRKPVFIFLLIIGPFMFAYQQYFYLHRQWIESNVDYNMIHYYSLVSEYIVRVLLLIIPSYVLWLFLDRERQKFYGFGHNIEGYKPYWAMLLVMLPLIAFASTQADFLSYYPKARVLNETGYTGAHKAWLTAQFELAYGFNFITIETFFRGFLVLAFVRFTGKAAIIPMACFYCSIHFGKPMFECISSLFGGMLLGIISYNTKSIWGGLVVHLGIAWMMELGAIIGNLVRH